MDFKIRDYTEYLAITGSHAYGLHTEKSDYDLRGFGIPPEQYFLSFFKRFEQHDQGYKFKDYPFWPELSTYINTHNLRKPDDNEIIDASIYDLRKFFKLAADCNPNIIEILFTDLNDVLLMTNIGKKVREHRELFLSAKAKFTFSGYAVSQLKRIKTHRSWLIHPPEKKPTRSDFGLPERSLISADQREAADKLLNKQVRLWLLEEAELDKTMLADIQEDLYELVGSVLNKGDRDEIKEDLYKLAAEKYEFSESYIDVLQREKRFRAAMREWQQYDTWKENRNPERAELERKYSFDAKHASHLVRLYRMGKEILTEGKVIVKRPDAEEIRAIRNGFWTYDQLIEWCKKQEEEMDDIYRNKKYVIPKKPDMNKLDALCQELIKEKLKGRKS